MSNKSINKVILIGYLGQDPDSKYTNNGNMVTTINLATSNKWKDKKSGEIKNKTEWHRIVFFGKIAEICSEYLKKGSYIYVEGQLQTRKWKNQEGIDKYITEIIVSVNGIMKILNNIKQNWNESSFIKNNSEIKNNIDEDDDNEENDDDDFNIKDNFEDDDISF
ncbi:single-stranded DNA-binding protein [endosymbiont of Euscepes postfasciatus]|uniref:single-stranded DNA-binding protein n=1 Tax=endosymbiont of Euscepes postfasciatus TaxID=650377 RepID=UPI000DC6FC99|nr:single-stranded DNA-binding protein [endosymbiont of Euscepes postfasciatus]BBA84719.1 single-stranded DNA-binding protein [endosymbiont of Euscepes postfasciatus]